MGFHQPLNQLFLCELSNAILFNLVYIKLFINYIYFMFKNKTRLKDMTIYLEHLNQA